MGYSINRNHEPDHGLQNALFEHQERLFERYSKLLMLRVDLSYKRATRSYDYADTHQLAADMTRLTQQCREVTGVVGCAWVMEFGDVHRLHVHAVIYINGQRHRKIWPFLERIYGRWKEITAEEGYVHRCEPKSHYRVRGERVVEYSDIKGRQGMQYILSYMGKQSQRTERRIYKLSDIPAPSVSGRRRAT